MIVDEIRAVVGDKRGAHLALSLERLVALCGEAQRIGLSATQKPLEDVGRFLAGTERDCELIDAGHLRKLDIGIKVPGSELSEAHRRDRCLSRGARRAVPRAPTVPMDAKARDILEKVKRARRAVANKTPS